MAPLVQGIAWWTHRDGAGGRGSPLSRCSRNHIGSKAPDALKISARRAEYSLAESALSLHFRLNQHTAKTFSCRVLAIRAFAGFKLPKAIRPVQRTERTERPCNSLTVRLCSGRPLPHERLHTGASTQAKNMTLISEADLWRVNNRRLDALTTKSAGAICVSCLPARSTEHNCVS